MTHQSLRNKMTDHDVVPINFSCEAMVIDIQGWSKEQVTQKCKWSSLTHAHMSF